MTRRYRGVAALSDENTNDEYRLFREAMQDVEPLNAEPTADTGAPRPAPRPSQRLADDRAVLDELRRGDMDEAWGVERGEALSFLRPGQSRRLLRRLRRGEFAVMAELDLHGKTVGVARDELGRFLAECRFRDIRCVRIIHGKGKSSSNKGPVLKGKVDRWLRQRDEIVAFCSAPSNDGGTGAVYVLLSFT